MTTPRALLPLFREMNDLKRIRVSGRAGSLAEQLFLRAWGRLASGEDLKTVALQEAAGAVAAARLAGIDAEVLRDAGLPEAESAAVLRRGFDAVAAPLDENLRAQLWDSLGAQEDEDEGGAEAAPLFAGLLADQPRAGATRPGHARVALEPAENHAEHCGVVAVYAVLAAPLYGADPALAFLTGLAHHLHNAYLPDAGDAGDALLGDHWKPMLERFRRRAIEELDPDLQVLVRESLDAVFRSDTPAGKTFQTADVLDRVLEMEWHARSAAFTLRVALHDMDIVHPGPVQLFQQHLVQSVGLMPPLEEIS